MLAELLLSADDRTIGVLRRLAVESMRMEGQDTPLVRFACVILQAADRYQANPSSPASAIIPLGILNNYQPEHE